LRIYLAAAVLLMQQASATAAPAPVSAATQKALASVRSSWFAEGDRVAAKTGNRDARFIMDMLKANTVLALPEVIAGRRAVRYLEDAKTDRPWFALITLPYGGMVPEAWRGPRDSYAAMYNPDMRTLVVLDVPISPDWKGIVLLHEGDHAAAMTYAPYDWRDDAEFCRAERDTHEFENDLVLALGGPAYLKLLNQEVARLRTNSEKKAIGTSFPNRLKYYDDLDPIFGPARSDFEKALRATHVWLHACFVLLERDYKGDVQEQKAKLLYSGYVRSGIR
jgi:hypothetical protein